VTFRYFAYGSNMWSPRMASRCPSARLIGSATLNGWTAAYDKPSTDGSAKLNIHPDAGGVTGGVVYEIEDSDRPSLDAAEPGYDPIETELGLTYTYPGEPSSALPLDWYVAIVTHGAATHRIPVPETGSMPDPDAPGIRPADEADLGIMQSILADGLTAGGDRYYPHPGELGWWMYHSDRRRPETWWLQGEDVLIVIDFADEGEIRVFARPGISPMPAINWARRRLGGRGAVGFVSDADGELVEWLHEVGNEPADIFRAYEWDLRNGLPTPSLPPGWVLRHVSGEREADDRRAASHAAFQSKMPAAMHLERYLGFMRSPVYVPERDLVAVSPEGRIASFMVWWADSSGIAQIEPFGTHPNFQRQGIGRALLLHGLGQMKEAGMVTCRVMTQEWREATSFYEGIGFRDVGRIT